MRLEQLDPDQSRISLLAVRQSDAELERAASILAGHVVRICLAEWNGDPLQLSRLLRGQAAAMQRASQKLARASIVALIKGQQKRKPS